MTVYPPASPTVNGSGNAQTHGSKLSSQTQIVTPTLLQTSGIRSRKSTENYLAACVREDAEFFRRKDHLNQQSCVTRNAMNHPH